MHPGFQRRQPAHGLSSPCVLLAPSSQHPSERITPRLLRRSTPWNALVFNTLWLQLQGFSDFHASLIASLFLLGTALGAQLGGILGDWAAERSPNHGRIIVAQVSVGIGVPLAVVVYKVRVGKGLCREAGDVVGGAVWSNSWRMGWHVCFLPRSCKTCLPPWH